MKQLVFLLVLNSCLICTSAQDQNEKNTPFFRTAYCRAKLYTWEGHLYDGLKVRLNLFTNELKFVKDNSDEIELTLSFNAKRIEFGDCSNNLQPAIFQSGFPKLNLNQTRETYYQILDSGKVLLLKYTRVVEIKNNVSATPALAYMASELRKYDSSNGSDWERAVVYYIYQPTGEIIELPFKPEAVIKVLKENGTAVQDFIKANQLKIKNEEELVKVVKYYNTL